MITDKKEIESVLQIGEKILLILLSERLTSVMKITCL
jgi:hypothetical protein